MTRRRPTIDIESLEARLANFAKQLRVEAEALPPGAGRITLERRARQAETGSHIGGWLDSGNLQTPK